MADQPSDPIRVADLLPWKNPTRQEQGRSEEKMSLKKLGLRQHPGSGSGSIRFDGSDDDVLLEHKLAEKSFTMNGQYLRRLYTEAVRQGKEAMMMVVFDKLDIYCIIQIKKGRPE